MTDKATTDVATVPERAVTPYMKADDLPALIAGIPDATGDAEQRIVEQLLNAKDIQDLNTPWESGKLSRYNGTVLTITELSKMPSDKDPVMGFFIVLRGTVRGTGEPFVASTSSHATMASLVRLWLADALPIDVVPRVASKPSRNGFYPEHLEIVSA